MEQFAIDHPTVTNMTEGERRVRQYVQKQRMLAFQGLRVKMPDEVASTISQKAFPLSIIVWLKCQNQWHPKVFDSAVDLPLDICFGKAKNVFHARD